MTWTVEWTEQARRDLRRLDRTIAQRATAAVDLAATSQGDVARLQGVDLPESRLRVGDWRIRFSYDFGARAIHVLRVLSRGRAYRE